MQNIGEGAIYAQAENQQVLNLLPIPIAILNGEQHHIIFANDAMFEFWRRDRSDQTIGQPLVAAFPEVNPTFLGQLKQVLQMGITYKDEEVLLTLNDQQGNPYSIYIDYTYQPIVNEHAKVTGVLVTAQDITHKVSVKRILKETSAQLEQSNHALSSSNQECRWPLKPPNLAPGNLILQKMNSWSQTAR